MPCALSASAPFRCWAKPGLRSQTPLVGFSCLAATSMARRGNSPADLMPSAPGRGCSVANSLPSISRSAGRGEIASSGAPGEAAPPESPASDNQWMRKAPGAVGVPRQAARAALLHLPCVRKAVSCSASWPSRAERNAPANKDGGGGIIDAPCSPLSPKARLPRTNRLSVGRT